ncbi:MAG: hydroxymethylbilane synthase [Lachnospiraceae bacterium]
MKKIVIGSRESTLAVVQTNMLKEYLSGNNSDLDVQILTMKTTGDKILDRPLEKIGGKGLFVKELDLALLDKRSDLSVHSLKDLPMEVLDDLPLLGVSKREDPRDVLVLPAGSDHIDLSRPIGCQSRRRILQLKALYPMAEIRSVRGNLQTRLRKLDSGEYSALILAAAGLKRLGLSDRISRYFTVEEMLPAAGQGVLAVQGRAGESYPDMTGFFDVMTWNCIQAERAFVRELDGGCSSPVAAHAVILGNQIQLTGLYYNEGTDTYEKRTVLGENDQDSAQELGSQLAKEMRENNHDR